MPCVHAALWSPPAPPAFGLWLLFLLPGRQQERLLRTFCLLPPGIAFPVQVLYLGSIGNSNGLFHRPRPPPPCHLAGARARACPLPSAPPGVPRRTGAGGTPLAGRQAARVCRDRRAS